MNESSRSDHQRAVADLRRAVVETPLAQWFVRAVERLAVAIERYAPRPWQQRALGAVSAIPVIALLAAAAYFSP